MQPKIVRLALIAGGVSVAVVLSGLARVQQSRHRVQQAAVARPLPAIDESELLGKYYFGNGLSVMCNLELKQNHRFTFYWPGTIVYNGVSNIHDQNLGHWELIDGVLVLKPERPNVFGTFSGMHVRFVPVKWGKRLYLVDENKLPGFCASVKDSEWRTERNTIQGRDYVKLEGDSWDLPPVTGAPLVPARFQEYVDSGAIKSVVVSRTGEGSYQLRQVGTPRLKVGMRLCARSDSYLPDLLVTAVEGVLVSAKALRVSRHEKRITRGTVFTTGDYWYRPWGTGWANLAP